MEIIRLPPVAAQGVPVVDTQDIAQNIQQLRQMIEDEILQNEQQRLRELAFVCMDIAEVAVSALKWDEVVTDRTNWAWQELFGMA